MSSVSSRPGEPPTSSGATKRKRTPGVVSTPVSDVPLHFGMPSSGVAPPRNAYGVPYAAIPPGDHAMAQMNGMGGMPMVNGAMNGPYLYPNGQPAPLYNHHMEPPPANLGPNPVQRSKSGGNGKNRGGAQGGQVANGAPTSNGSSPVRQGPPPSSAPPTNLPPELYVTGSAPMAPPISTSFPHAPRPPTHGGDYEVLQGLAPIPVLPPGHMPNGVPAVPSHNGVPQAQLSYPHSIATAAIGVPVLSQYPFAAVQTPFPGLPPGLRPGMAPLHPQLESKLKEAIEQGQPVQHLKLLIEGHMKLEEKKHKKRAANRRSASSSRARKKKYIEKLAHENRRLKRISRILAILPDLVMVVNEEGNITFASWRSQKVLQSAKQLAGQAIFDVVVPECHEKIRHAINNTLAQQDGQKVSVSEPIVVNNARVESNKSEVSTDRECSMPSCNDQGEGPPHHSSGGINSQRQCAQQAATHLPLRDVQGRKNQVCLKRQDGSSMWCTMRATLFMRPTNLKDENEDKDPDCSDNDDASDASGNGEGLNGCKDLLPEVILSFRPLEKEPMAFIKQEVSSTIPDGNGNKHTIPTNGNSRPAKKAKLKAGIPPPFPNGRTVSINPNGVKGTTSNPTDMAPPPPSTGANLGLPPPPPPPPLKQNGMRNDGEGKWKEEKKQQQQSGTAKSKDHAQIELEAAKSLMRMGNPNGNEEEGEGEKVSEAEGAATTTSSSKVVDI